MILVEFNVDDSALKCEIKNTYKADIQTKFQVPRYYCYVNDTHIIYNKPAKDVQNVFAEFINTSSDLIFTTRSGHVIKQLCRYYVPQ
jgi:hypothetical protein